MIVPLARRPLQRNLVDARRAFGSRDVAASVRAHNRASASAQDAKTDLQTQLLDREDLSIYFDHHQEAHLETSGEYVKAFVFGGLDGIVTIFAIIAGCVGADISASQIFIIGIGNLLADAFSMGFGEYIGSKAEDDYIQGEKAREQWELDNYPEGERAEMIEIYCSRYHFSKDDAITMVNVASKYPAFFLQHMMIEELGLKIEDNNDCTPLKKGLLMFASFGAFGMIPLIGFAAYLAGYQFFVANGSVSIRAGFVATFLVTLVTLFVLGMFKAKFSNQNRWLSGLTMMINGALASAAAFGSGIVLKSVLS